MKENPKIRQIWRIFLFWAWKKDFFLLLQPYIKKHC